MRKLSLLVVLSSACTATPVFDDKPEWPDPELPAIGAGKIIVTNSGDDTLSWIDLSTITTATAPVFTQPVGFLPPEREGPHHGAAATDGASYFVGLSNYVPGSGSGPHGSHGTGTVDGYLLKFDTATLELVGQARVSKSPGDVRATPDGALVLQSHYDLVKIQEWAESGSTDVTLAYAPIAIVDAETMDTTLVDVCPAPHGIAITSDSKLAFTSCGGSDEVGVLDIAARTATRIQVGETPVVPGGSLVHDAYSLAIRPDDAEVWVSCLKTGDIRVLARGAGGTYDWSATRGPIAVGGVPFFGTFNAAGTRYFAPAQAPNALVVVDVATATVEQTLPILTEACYQPHAVVLTPDESHALVVCEGDHAAPDISPGSIAVVALNESGGQLLLTVVNSIPVGIFPDDAFIIGGQ